MTGVDHLLTALGCDDIEMTKARFLNDLAFYLMLTKEMLLDPGFEQLGQQLEKQEVVAAFDTAHMLKGIVSNCGITPLCELIVQIVEQLRGGKPDFALVLERYRRLMDQKNEAQALLLQYDDAADHTK